MSQDSKQDRMSKILSLLTQQTLDGTIEWVNTYKGFQASLGRQSVVLSNTNVSRGSLLNMFDTATLEIRGPLGDLQERIDGTNSLQGILSYAHVTGYGPEITQAVQALYQLVVERREQISDAAVTNLLDTLESRSK